MEIQQRHVRSSTRHSLQVLVSQLDSLVGIASDRFEIFQDDKYFQVDHLLEMEADKPRNLSHGQ